MGTCRPIFPPPARASSRDEPRTVGTAPVLICHAQSYLRLPCPDSAPCAFSAAGLPYQNIAVTSSTQRVGRIIRYALKAHSRRYVAGSCHEGTLGRFTSLPLPGRLMGSTASMSSQDHRVVDVCGRERYREWDTPSVRNKVALRALLSFIRRIRSGFRAPFGRDGSRIE